MSVKLTTYHVNNIPDVVSHEYAFEDIYCYTRYFCMQNEVQELRTSLQEYKRIHDKDQEIVSYGNVLIVLYYINIY